MICDPCNSFKIAALVAQTGHGVKDGPCPPPSSERAQRKQEMGSELSEEKQDLLAEGWGARSSGGEVALGTSPEYWAAF